MKFQDFPKKSYLQRVQWRYHFYLSCVRILVSPWLLTWLANYKRASRSGTRPVHSRCKDGTVTGNFLDELPNYHIHTLSELEEHSGRFAKVSESDVEKSIEVKKMQKTLVKKFLVEGAPQNQRNRENSSNWIRQLLEQVCFSGKDQGW